jgi:hypothetical protein
MAGKTSASQTAYYSRYKSNRTWEKNRIARLQRTLKQQPNNLQVQEALKKGPVYRRGTPKTPQWSHSAIATAKLVRQFTGVCDPAWFSANPDAAFKARNKTKNTEKSKPFDKDAFSIAARARIKVVQ